MRELTGFAARLNPSYTLERWLNDVDKEQRL
jgi:hypothetical protein